MVRAGVVIVGFGAAGACAAIEAAEAGADVLVLDRFSGGGATALSGGVVYAGGGTRQQLEAGVADTPDAMYSYLCHEVGDAVSPETLRRFCDTSSDSLRWLEAQGVPFGSSLCPYKTSYPTNRHYLYYSGSEAAFESPAPRGHRTKGRGTSGKLLFARLAKSVADKGVRIVRQTTAQRLLTDGTGRVTAVECRSLAEAPAWVRTTHRLLGKWASKPGLYVPALRRRLHKRIALLEQHYGRPLVITATDGVILTAGGFVANRAMMKEHAPAYRGGLALGTMGDDGSGITLGVEMGAATGKMDHVSAWRFLTPPSALLEGTLIDVKGQQVCDLNRYGAAVGHAMITEHDGRAWLLLDHETVTKARSQLREQTVWFQRLQAWYLLTKARVSAPTLDELAARTGVDLAGLDVPGDPPYSLIDVSIRPSVAYPCPMLTLGGLVVDEETGQVRRPDGTTIAGLYAAGRSAVGLCSNSYVSGLSLADCVYSGRRAGRASAQR